MLDGHGLEDRRHVVHQSLQALLGIEEWCAWRVVQRPYVLWLNDLILIDEYTVRGFSSSSCAALQGTRRLGQRFKPSLGQSLSLNNNWEGSTSSPCGSSGRYVDHEEACLAW